MIKNIMGGNGIKVVGNTSSFPYINMSSPSSGMVRYNGNTQNLEIYDGTVWLATPGSYPTIELTSEVRELLEWARKKQHEELHLQELTKTNPAIDDLVKQIEEKQEQIKIVQSLIKEEVKVGTS